MQKLDEQKEAPKEDKDTYASLQKVNLNEAQYTEWSKEDVWEWIKIKQGWNGKMDGYEQNKLDGYKAKMFEIGLDGAKLVEVQQDVKVAQTVMKAIGFPFSERKKVYKMIQDL